MKTAVEQYSLICCHSGATDLFLDPLLQTARCNNILNVWWDPCHALAPSGATLPLLDDNSALLTF